jgi:hypothetical protein
MKEVNRIDVGLTELRIMKDEQGQWCELFEAGEWNRVSATKLHQLSFNKSVYEWLNQHYFSPNYIEKFPDDTGKTNIIDQATRWIRKSVSLQAKSRKL